jgi:hypothetical protein
MLRPTIYNRELPNTSTLFSHISDIVPLADNIQHIHSGREISEGQWLLGKSYKWVTGEWRVCSRFIERVEPQADNTVSDKENLDRYRPLPATPNADRCSHRSGYRFDGWYGSRPIPGSGQTCLCLSRRDCSSPGTGCYR